MLILKIEIMWIEDDRILLNTGNYVSVYKENPNNTSLSFSNNYIGPIKVDIIPKLTDKYTEIDIIKSKDVNYLSNYTDEQLKAELDKRKLARREEKETILRCRHCANFDFDDTRPAYQSGHCTKQLIVNKKGITRYRIMGKSTKACDMFIHKDNEKIK